MSAQKLFAGFLVVTIVAFLAACAGTSTASPTSAPAPTPEPPAPTTTTATLVPATPTPTLEEGKLIDVGGYRLYIECQGEGSPTVVLDAGFGGGHEVWSILSPVQPKVAAFTRVCAYDRAGRRNSDKGPWTAENPNTTLQMVKDLKTLLRGAHLDAPYVLAGQSFGGMVVRLYGSTYPADVAGMVLVDAATDESYDARGIEIADAISLKSSAEQVRNAGPFPNIPLIVLTHGDPGKGPQLGVDEQDWQESQRHLLKLSPQSKQIIAEKSGHNIHYNQPDLVIDAIRQVVESVRHR